jgi:hypothetical protein
LPILAYNFVRREGWKTGRVEGWDADAAAAVDFVAAFGESPVIIIYYWCRMADP